MKGAVLYTTKYGSTAEYAGWIGEAAELPVLNVQKDNVDLDAYDFLILATPVIYYKLLITDWVQENLAKLDQKPVIMVTVSGAPPGPKLDAWVGDSLPTDFIARAKHVALRGRQVPGELSWFDRMMLIIAAWKNPDPVASEEELKGFDYMDRNSIAPVVALARKYQLCTPAAAQDFPVM
ncbi:flavodoxin domain-containing protein [Aliiroseovarius sp. F20344]|uniref:flavodoxin domain-containing protein n=1 Tax=Aliiroseovarius sp. F20344 TaxID=2926414 RepID=UPI001FF4CDB4|nr:flavodoxin domain-containing protein [Aliiroseovarius sp. F20344]